MSSVQQTLGDVSQADGEEDQREEKPQWAPGESTTDNECRSCGGHVSKSFARTHGDEHGVVHACVNCAPQNKLKWLAAGLKPRVGGARR